MMTVFFTLSSMSDFFGKIPQAIGSAIGNAIATGIGKLLYYVIIKGLLRLVNLLYQLYSVFAGLKKVEYDGTKMSIVNVFFDNSIISNVYWAMALVGMAMVFGFAIFAVVRKVFDIDDKQRASLGSILRNCFKSILTMLLLSLCVSAVLNGTNVLMQTFSYIFNNAESLNKTTHIEYSEGQYATMARVLNTIGNYSLSPSRESRYNINACFNKVRVDLQTLTNEGVFNGYYETEDKEGNAICNWLTVLQEVAHSADLSEDLSLDVYYESVATAMTNAMNTIRNNPDIASLKDYSFDVKILDDTEDSILDRTIFLAGTTGAANSSNGNANPTFTDGVRSPFYYGTKSIYSIDDVSGSFNIKLGGIDYVLIAIVAVFILKTLYKSIMICISRIFLMISLYVVAPPIIATMPWDDGEKFKQWVQAFLIQALSVFGTVVPMRIAITMIPIIMADNLVLFPANNFLNVVSKVFLLVGALTAIDGFSSMLNGLLSNNGAMASMRASEMAGGVGEKLFNGSVSAATTAAQLGKSVGFGALGLAWSGVSAIYDKATSGKGEGEGEAGGEAKTVKGSQVEGDADQGTVDQQIQSKLGEGSEDKGEGAEGEKKGSEVNGEKDKGEKGGEGNGGDGDGSSNAQDFLKAAGVQGDGDNGGENAEKKDGEKKDEGNQEQPKQPNFFQRMGNAFRSFFSRGNNNDNNKKGAGVEGSKDNGNSEGIEMQDLGSSDNNSNSSDNSNQGNLSEGSNAEGANEGSNDGEQNKEENNPLKGAGLDADGDNGGGSMRGASRGADNSLGAYGAAAMGESAAQPENNNADNNGEQATQGDPNKQSEQNSDSNGDNNSTQQNTEANNEPAQQSPDTNAENNSSQQNPEVNNAAQQNADSNNDAAQNNSNSTADNNSNQQNSEPDKDNNSQQQSPETNNKKEDSQGNDNNSEKADKGSEQKKEPQKPKYTMKNGIKMQIVTDDPLAQGDNDSKKNQNFNELLNGSKK